MKKNKISGGFLIMALSLFSSCATLGSVTKEANLRFNTYQEKSKSVQTSYGKITFIDEGEGPAILSIHGICGGYDQGFETLEKETEHYRIIAPSRFGYLGTDLPENARIETQCEAYCQLLDSLNLDKVYLLATSAGGTSAIKMVLIHPERVSGLILYSSGYPALEPPKKTVKFAGPPAPFCNDFAMWLISPLFKSIMGMPKSVWLTTLQKLRVVIQTINLITDKIIEGVLGHMLEDIVIFETKRELVKNSRIEKKSVYKIRFENHEYDMLVYDANTNTCEAYEIKHTSEPFPNQYRHLINEDFVQATEKRFGHITKRCVLYRGKTYTEENGIEYKNVEEYLCELG